MSPSQPARALIVLRESPDWGRLDRSYLDRADEHDRVTERPEGFTRHVIELWDDTFTVGFFEIRQRLKELTLANFRSVVAAEVVPLDHLGPVRPEQIVLFSDDDDWFAPDLVATLADHAEGSDGMTWTSVLFDGAFERRPQIFCFTNNYAVVGRALGSPGVELDTVSRHIRAQRIFHREKTIATVHIPLPLSVTNKHPASTIVMEAALGERPGRDGLVHCVEQFNARGSANRPAADFAWAEEPAARVVELFAGAGLR